MEPTCTETGLTEGKHCTVCGEVLTAQEEVPALGHTEETDAAVEPTCTETGLTEGKHCTVCGEVLTAQEEVPALGHTSENVAAVKPTCTETGLTQGRVCSVCGETLIAQREIPALGHTEAIDEAVLPTCTEPGLMEGKHCSVCGEVLEAQEEIAAYGHMWKDATYLNPKTCMLCGATEGEALGNKVFTGLFGKTSEEKENLPLRADLTVTASSEGFDEIDEILSNSSLSMKMDLNNEVSILDMTAVLNGSAPIQMVMTVDDEIVGVTVPGIDDNYYCMTREFLDNECENSCKDADNVSELADCFLNTDKAKEKLAEYGLELVGIINNNVTEAEETYHLEGLDMDADCIVLSCRPTKEDWSAWFSGLANKLVNDEDLQKALEKVSVYSADGTSAMGSLDEMLAVLPLMSGPIADMLDGSAVTLAISFDNAFALKLENENIGAVGYESCVSEEGTKKSALVLYGEEPQILAESGFVSEGEKFDFGINIPLLNLFAELFVTDTNEAGDTLVGTLHLDGKTAEFNMVTEETGNALTVPSGEKIIIDSKEKMEAAMQSISDKLDEAEVFGHHWMKATCQAPKTCAVCGATEGGKASHDFTEPDENGIMTCTVCGVQKMQF